MVYDRKRDWEPRKVKRDSYLDDNLELELLKEDLENLRKGRVTFISLRSGDVVGTGNKRSDPIDTFNSTVFPTLLLSTLM